MSRAEAGGALPAAEVPSSHKGRNPEATLNGALRATGANVGRAR